MNDYSKYNKYLNERRNLVLKILEIDREDIWENEILDTMTNNELKILLDSYNKEE
jgi:hypothetical protein